MPVTVNTDLPWASERDRSWDGPAAAQRMRDACTSGDSLDEACMGQGFLYRDPDADPQTIGAYKFPVADIIDGEKRLVLEGVYAAAAYLDRGDVPETDRDRMRSALTELYDEASDAYDDDTIEAPWDRDMDASAAPVTAAVDTWAPPADWFKAGPPAPLTVTPEGRIYGDLARFGQRHIGIDGRDQLPPRDPDGSYKSFRQRTIRLDNGEEMHVGVLTMDTGHADMGLRARPAAAHYDDTGAMVAAVTIGEDDEEGGRIWIAGALLPDVTDEQKTRLSLSGVSGDWRQVRRNGPLELVAALAVNVPGFPVPAGEKQDYALAASAVAMVAAGMVAPSQRVSGGGGASGTTMPVPDKPKSSVTIDIEEMLVERIVASAMKRVEDERRAELERLQTLALNMQRADRARACHAALTASVSGRRRARAAAAHGALVAAGARRRHHRATVANGVLRDQLRSRRARLAQASLVSAASVRGLVAQGGRFLDAQGRNWVEQTGGLPEGIRAVADELLLKGFQESHAIATAVNVIKRWCWGSPDGLNWPGIQNVTPRTRARGCANLLQWNINRAIARAT